MLIRTTTFFGEKVGGLGSRWSPAGGVGLYGLLFESDRSRWSVGQVSCPVAGVLQLGFNHKVGVHKASMLEGSAGWKAGGRAWAGGRHGRMGLDAAGVRAGRSWRAD